MNTAELQAAVEQLLAGRCPAGWQWVQSSPMARVASYSEPAGGTAECYFKCFMPRSPFEEIKTLVRGSRCARAVKSSQLLVAKGFLTPQVLASGRRGRREWMVTAAVDAIGVGHYIASFLATALTATELAWKRDIIRAVGTLVGQLHQAGIIHGDLRPSNILIDCHNVQPLFYLIDNERNSQHPGGIPDKLRLKNLVQINMLLAPVITHRDRWRFFRRYCEARSYSGAQAKTLARQVQTRTWQRLQGKHADRLADGTLNRAVATNLPVQP